MYHTDNLAWFTVTLKPIKNIEAAALTKMYSNFAEYENRYMTVLASSYFFTYT